MPALQRLGVRGRLAALMLIFAARLIGVEIASHSTLRQVRVGGGYYSRILTGKDLWADILPPLLYITEADQTMLRRAGETNRDRVKALVAVSTRVAGEFQARRAHGDSVLPAGAIRDTLFGRVTRPALELFEVMDQLYIPALERGDRETAYAMARGVLTETYEPQRRAIDG